MTRTAGIRVFLAAASAGSCLSGLPLLAQTSQTTINIPNTSTFVTIPGTSTTGRSAVPATPTPTTVPVYAGPVLPGGTYSGPISGGTFVNGLLVTPNGSYSNTGIYQGLPAPVVNFNAVNNNNGTSPTLSPSSGP
ncbi:hypothetical protein [Gloeobacter kilaueensis]|uniref:Uncharacterized protein n=1 Tax=Gloeobacter kilaueensis (strain ATCC BAA-2537 / CCAP 1431/1 / ULC 316 / JS1) TaxID=1183438 RepID=U5QJC0_GLOK1|nr:hypothetical protein [Gloeobacter kilaueensis]AGY59011.1 hypothetical protein GKIL_2765 [Gloeobacter kilaueensis JS1]